MSISAKNKQTSPSAIAKSACPATCDHAVEVWKDMLIAGTKLLRAGLRREIGPSGDIDEAYRQWYAAQMQEHHRKVQRIVQRLREAEARNAG
ncbi:MAG: hypothetical protein U9N87_13015 [Planctomycetota bacterium]|nr:hypothetical protein [Planctomycetota bacterium]